MTESPKQLDAIFPHEILCEREGKPLLSPRSTEEIVAIARQAHARNLAIEITGTGTKRTWGNPVEAALQLDTTRLNRVLEHPWQDLTCTVQAGCVWADLQRTLAANNQFVALDPLWPERATVGGIVATNDSGTFRHRYGSLRDLILGMTLVLADGTIARTGGKVVKNVAGYDLHKLMTGSFGTLAIIAEVTFRLHPLPLHPQTFTVSAPQASQLAPLMAAIRNSHLLTQALQLCGNAKGFHLDIQLNAHPDAKQDALLGTMIEVSGLTMVSTSEITLADDSRAPHASSASAAASEIGLGFSLGIEAAGDPGFSPRDTPSSPQSNFPNGTVRSCPVEDFQTAREALFQPNATVIKLSVSSSELCKYLDHMQRTPDVEITCVAQSSGTIYASLTGTSTAIESYLKSIQADFSILATPLKLDHWKANPDSLALMREIKRQFDPNRILNPGRFLGGI